VIHRKSSKEISSILNNYMKCDMKTRETLINKEWTKLKRLKAKVENKHDEKKNVTEMSNYV
jgi:hypothetical protein